MVTLDVTQARLDTAPVIVTSPTTRCGTTLVQRLLCASDNAFIYGEEIGHQIETLTALFLNQIRLCESRGEALADDFSKALAGALSDWRPAMAPPAHVLLRAWTDTYFQLPAAFSRYGGDIGRPIWGFKWPACSIDSVKALLALMPRTKIVFVMRDPIDALKSAKARRFVNSHAQVAGFCAQWARNTEAFLSLKNDQRILILRYELLVNRREEQLAALSAFTGVQNISADPFEVKVNTFVGHEADGHSPSQYIAPAELTAAERAAVFDHAGALMAAHYPQTLPCT